MAIQSFHILISRTDNIGDVVLTLPITAWIKQQFPSIRISFLCRAYAADVVRLCSTVDHVIEVESISYDPVDFFKKTDIDTVIFAQPNQRLAIAAAKAGISNRIGNARQKLYLLLFCNRRIRFSKRISDLHEAQFNFEFLRPLGLTAIPHLDTIRALYGFKNTRNTQIEKLLQPHGFNLIFHTKSNGHGREWPMAHYLALAKQLGKNSEVHIWTTGSANEGQWLEQHAPELLTLPNVTNVCGQFTLGELTSFIHSAQGLIASGTGPLHLSAALGQRTLGLFPPTRPMHPGRWKPVGKRAQYLSESASCIGCEKKQTATCECMEKISPTDVENIVSQWFSEETNFRTTESIVSG